MDAPSMVMHKHVPEDVGLRNIAAAEEEGGQGQMHRGDEKQHKPVLKKVKEKVKKIKNTIAGGHGGNNGGGENGAEYAGGSNSSSSSEEDEQDVAAQRVGEVDQGGYQEDVEDKPVAMESDPEVHGAPMYDSARIPAVQEVEGDDAPRLRLGDLGGPVVEDPAAPHTTTPAPREGEDIGTTPVVRAFESMSVSDDPKHVGAWKPDIDVPKDPMPVSDAAGGEEWKDAATDGAPDGAAPENAASGATYTDKIKSAAAGTTEYGKKLATTVYEKVAGVSTAVAGKVQQVTQSAGTATPGVGGSQDNATVTATTAGEPTSGQQDKGVTVTGYIADKLRPGYEDRELSKAISGAVQRRKDDVGSAVPAAPGNAMAKARDAPAQVLTKAREAVTSLTGGSRVSETVQPTTEENVTAEGAEVQAPVVRGEEIGDPQPQPNASMT
ncbi:hypothetical protein E2562_010703 [Oryza meyeriana var. granulata]|uniref:Uncharacterized protein n=1 Tax=Oryza meyeriana var. granulata TaxID=110450 RepID=A0A6G1EW52_9ORYZ|nr:hypothetical protein E2562_010703 [Oryza meyeriana var. granulata]